MHAVLWNSPRVRRKGKSSTSGVGGGGGRVRMLNAAAHCTTVHAIPVKLRCLYGGGGGGGGKDRSK